MVGFDGSEMDDFREDGDEDRVEQEWPEGQKADCVECGMPITYGLGTWFHLRIDAMHEAEPDVAKMALPNPMDRPIRELEAIWLVTETQDGKVHHFAFFEQSTAMGLADSTRDGDEKLAAWEGNDGPDSYQHWEWSNVDASHTVSVDLVNLLPGPQWRT